MELQILLADLKKNIADFDGAINETDMALDALEDYLRLPDANKQPAALSSLLQPCYNSFKRQKELLDERKIIFSNIESLI